jgi:hypothetical protein
LEQGVENPEASNEGQRPKKGAEIMKPFYFIFPAVILLVVAAVDLSHRGAFDLLGQDKADAAEQEAREEVVALGNRDLDSKLRQLNRSRQLQGLPTYNVR